MDGRTIPGDINADAEKLHDFAAINTKVLPTFVTESNCSYGRETSTNGKKIFRWNKNQNGKEAISNHTISALRNSINLWQDV
jgi:hypothetical protein